METVKMTERAILNAMIDGTIDPDVMAEYATKKLAQLDKHNETARIRMAKKRAEGDALTEKVFAVLGNEPMSREDVLDVMKEEFPELTVGKVSYRLSALAREGRIVKQEATVVGGGSEKTRRITVYTVA